MVENEEKIREHFEIALKKSGYSLQTRVETKLRAMGYTVRREQPYVDKDENKGRSIDLIAQKFIPDIKETKASKPVVSSLKLIIECKNLPDNAWIFFGGENTYLPIPEFRSLTENLPDEPLKDMIPLCYFPELFQAADYAEFVRDNKNKDNEMRVIIQSNKKENNLYDAIQKVIKATNFESSRVNKEFQAQMRFFKLTPIVVPFFIYYSIIVFQGRMYRADLVGDENKLTDIKCVEIQKKYVSSNYNEESGRIHIVSFDYLDKYMALLSKRFSSASKRIIENQSKLLGAIDAHWQKAYPQYSKS